MPATVFAQRGQDGETAARSVTIPGEGLVRLSAEAPQRMRVGESFEYVIQVTNASDNVVLHDVKIAQQDLGAVSVESVQIQGQKKQGQQNRQSQRQNQQKKGNRQQQQNQQQARGNQGQGQQQHTWTINRLEPGQTREIIVTAAGESEGQQQMCLAVLSYTPSLCLSTEFVKPDVTIVKEAPGQASLCEVIEFAYYVKNEGSGDPGTFTVHDPLGQGLMTVEGKDEVRFEVDGLKPGETRKFVAELRAEEPGRYSSRAIAILADDNRTQSKKITTQVQEADLDVAIDGPQTQYINRVLNYTVRITNNGEIAAPDVTLDLLYPSTTAILRVSDPQDSSNAVSAEASEQARAGQQNQQRRRNQQLGQQRQQRGQNAEREDASVAVGTLEPGETVAINFAARSDQAEALRFQAMASFVCGIDEDRERFVAREQFTTDLIALPALAIAVTDSQDPVAVGQELVYTVVVQNEGEASDKNVQVTVELPKVLKFVDASGTTDVKHQGQKLTFSPIDELEAGETATWKVRASAEQAGELALAVTLNSEGLNKSTVAEEPTRLFKTSEQASGQQKKQN